MEAPTNKWHSIWKPELICLIIFAALTRFWSLFFPNAVVFDEVYFKVFAAHYLDGHYFFDIHPPLGKLLLAGWARLIGLHAPAMLNGTALGMRILPAAAGTFLVPLMWGLLRRLGATRPFAFLGASLVLLDNAVLVESRFILMDSMLLLFGLSALYFYLVAQPRTDHWRWLWITLAAVSAGAAVSVKWTGLNAIAIVLLLWIADQRDRRETPSIHRLIEAAIIVLVPVIIYVSVFWIHFQLLPYSGSGDAFMSPQFQATLIGSPYYDPHAHMSFIEKFYQLNKEMYEASATLTASHPYGSKWYTWPLEIRPVYYWEGSVLPNGTQGNIYLLGNPVIWWGIWIAIITGLGYLWASGRKLKPRTIASLSLATVGYLINFMPFIGITRVMFLYSYFFAFCYSIIFVIMLWNDIATNRKGEQFSTLRQRQVYVAILLLIVIGFLYFAPLTYGSPLTTAGLQARMWLHSWR